MEKPKSENEVSSQSNKGSIPLHLGKEKRHRISSILRGIYEMGLYIKDIDQYIGDCFQYKF